MIGFAGAKVNIGLNIIKKRIDGFHELETIFYPVQLCDVIEIIPNNQQDADTQFFNTGINIQAGIKNNLCLNAYRLLQKAYNLPPVSIYLHKIIPIGAGLGGGSSDAVMVLHILNETFDLQLSKKQLIDYSNQLGSDCAFFVENQPTLATGRGEKLEPLSLNLDNYYLVVLYPNIHISTAKAYAGTTPKKNENSLKELIELPVAEWKRYIRNDFEESIFQDYPEIKRLKEKLYAFGAIYSSMSGSGSSVYGIFNFKPKMSETIENAFVWQGVMNTNA